MSTQEIERRQEAVEEAISNNKRERLEHRMADKAQLERERECERMEPKGHRWKTIRPGKGMTIYMEASYDTVQQCECCFARRKYKATTKYRAAWFRLAPHEN